MEPDRLPLGGSNALATKSQLPVQSSPGSLASTTAVIPGASERCGETPLQSRDCDANGLTRGDSGPNVTFLAFPPLAAHSLRSKRAVKTTVLNAAPRPKSPSQSECVEFSSLEHVSGTVTVSEPSCVTTQLSDSVRCYGDRVERGAQVEFTRLGPGSVSTQHAL